MPLIVAAGDTASRVQEDTADVNVDPWEGIFPEEIDLSEGDYNGEEDLEIDDLDEDAWSLSGSESHYGYGSSSDEEDAYTGNYVRPPWAPPIIDIPHSPVIDLDTLRMLRRGATMEMIERFDMRYDSSCGLMVSLMDGYLNVCLGWNIELMIGDENGAEFMEWVQDDIQHRPDRWEIQHVENEDVTNCWKLVREDGEDDDEPGQSWFSDDE